MTRDYAIVTDVTCDLNPKLYEELDVIVLPMPFQLGQTSYLQYADCRELSSKDLYKALREGQIDRKSVV